MIHLRKLPAVWSKSTLQYCKSPLSKSKLLGVLLKAECSSSVRVEENSREPNTNADDTNKEATNVLSKISRFTNSMDRDSIRDVPKGRKLYQDDGGLVGLRGQISIEDFKEFVKMEKDLQNVHVSMLVLHKLCLVLRSKIFPVSDISRYKDLDSLVSLDELKTVFETIERNLEFLDEIALRKVFEACTILKISDRSLLMQKLLKLLSSNINSMSSINVIFMYSLTEMYYSKDNPQVAALHTACNEFFENCFESNIHPKTTPMTMSRFVFLEFLPVNIRKYLILRITESKANMPFWSYSYVLKGLISPGVFEDDEFYKKCLKYVLSNIRKILETNDLSPNVFFFLKTYKTGILSQRISYDEGLLDTLALKIVKTEPPLLVAVQFCLHFFQIGHFNYALFDYILQKVEKALQSGELKKLDEEMFFKLTKILSKGVRQHPKMMNSFLREKLEAICLNYTKVNVSFKYEMY